MVGAAHLVGSDVGRMVDKVLECYTKDLDFTLQSM